MASPPISYGLRWSADIVAIPIGAGPMSIPDQQRLKVADGSPLGGGVIAITSTGNYPTSTNITNACTTMATNCGTVLNAVASASIWQGWYTGGG